MYWRDVSFPVALRTADQTLRAEVGGIPTALGVGDISSVLPIVALNGLKGARSRLLTPVARGLVLRRGQVEPDQRGWDLVSLFLPLTRRPALKAQLREVARTEPAVRRDLELARPVLGDMDPALALGYLYFLTSRGVWWADARNNWPPERKQAGYWRLAEAGFAAQAFRAGRGRWPVSIAEMTPDYLSPEMKVPAQKEGILEDKLAGCGYAPMNLVLDSEPVTTATILDIYRTAGLVLGGGSPAPSMLSFQPIPGGKVRVSWRMDQFGTGDALHAIYLAEALRRWPAQAETTTTLWENLPGGKDRVPMDPERARAQAAAMEAQQESYRLGAGRTEPYRGPVIGPLTFEIEAVFPERVFVVKAMIDDLSDAGILRAPNNFEQAFGLQPDPWERMYP